MTREEHLAFCKQCTNRKLDLKQGIICTLTGEKADFEGECPDYQNDPTVPEPSTEYQEAVHHDQLSRALSPEKMKSLLAEQRWELGLGMGILAGIGGAIVWGVLTVATGYQIGFMAVGIGALVGIAIRNFGKGLEPKFGIAGGAISLFSVLLGNFFSVIGFIAPEVGLSYFEVILQLDYSYLPEIMMDSFSIIDILFYVLAVVEGYKFSFRQLNLEDLKRQANPEA